MKNLIVIIVVLAVLIACSSTATSNQPMTEANKTVSKNDTVRIANDSLGYEVIITDSGFNTYLNSIARPRSYYSLSFLETKNLFLVSEYNRRVLEPYRYDPNIYEMRIDYQSKIRYGHEVNYLLYNYFMFFQKEYRQKL